MSTQNMIIDFKSICELVKPVRLDYSELDIIGSKVRSGSLCKLSGDEQDFLEEFRGESEGLHRACDIVRTKDLRSYKPFLSAEDKCDVLVNFLYFVAPETMGEKEFNMLGYGGLHYYFYNADQDCFDAFDSPEWIFELQDEDDLY